MVHSVLGYQSRWTEVIQLLKGNVTLDNLLPGIFLPTYIGGESVWGLIRREYSWFSLCWEIKVEGSSKHEGEPKMQGLVLVN